MATEVYTTEEIRLLDETEVELRPLPIAKLRKFTRMWSEHIQGVTKKIAENEDKEEGEDKYTEADLTDEQFDTFIKMCALGLEGQLKGEKTDKQFISYLEDTLDEQTIYKILEVTGGLKLGGANTPNQIPPVAAGAGTN